MQKVAGKVPGGTNTSPYTPRHQLERDKRAATLLMKKLEAYIDGKIVLTTSQVAAIKITLNDCWRI